MSNTKAFFFRCDFGDCATAQTIARPSLKLARDRLTELKWYVVGRQMTAEYCPEHADDAKARRP